MTNFLKCFSIYYFIFIIRGFSGGSVVKNLPANAGDIRDTGSIPGLGRSPAGGHGNLLQYSYLENLMDRVAWQGVVLRSLRVGHKWLSMHTCTIYKTGKADIIKLILQMKIQSEKQHLVWSDSCISLGRLQWKV